jgi:hypothetical protein
MFGFGKSRDKKYISDVKTRSRKARSHRARMAISALGVSTGLVLAVLVLWKGTEAALERFVYTNPAFAINQLDIRTDGIIPVEQIRNWAGLKIGDNLLVLDLHKLKRDLELVPLISRASVERVLPRRLIIRVTEREPIARIRIFTPRAADGLLEPGVLYLDEEGVVIPPIARQLNAQHFDAATEHLPFITGITPGELRPGHAVESPQIHAALKWILAYSASRMAASSDVLAIDVGAPGTLVVTSDYQSEVTFSSRNFEPQLARWEQILMFGRRSEKNLASLDLAVTNYIPVAWQESTNSLPVIPQPKKHIPYKKRHV